MAVAPEHKRGGKGKISNVPLVEICREGIRWIGAGAGRMVRGLLQVALVVKNLPANARDTGLIPGSGRLPWSQAWQPTPIFLPGEFNGQRSLASYSP